MPVCGAFKQLLRELICLRNTFSVWITKKKHKTTFYPFYLKKLENII